MNRIGEIKKHLLGHLASGAPGLEIAPWHSPVLPKSRFPSVFTLDIFPYDELIARARSAQPPVAKKSVEAIEPPDFIGNAANLAAAIPAELRGKLKFILSSHNLEHLPNPIKFLADCADLLPDDGVLVMAIPDKRACFDHWRPLSSLGQVVEAHVAERLRPSVAQLVDHNLGRAYVDTPDGPATVFPIDTPEDRIHSDNSRFAIVADQLRDLKAERAEDDPYVSAHCWTFIPESFALLLRDLADLRMISLYSIEISESVGGEFFAHLSKQAKTRLSREILCRRMMAAQGGILESEVANPRRYRRLFTAYMALLRLVDRLLFKTA